MNHNPPIHSSDALIERAVAIARAGRKKNVVVAAAQDIDVIGAVMEAVADGFINAYLVGDKNKIQSLASEKSFDLSNCEIIDVSDPIQAAHTAIGMASVGEADVIMKGFLPTSALLKVVLDKKYKLRGKNTLSHCALLDIPGYHKLLNLTDGGMIVKPNPEQKFQILENAVLVAKALNLTPVKVAVSGVYPKNDDVNLLIPKAIKQFKNLKIETPLTLDLATSSTAGKNYQREGEVFGDADIFLVDSIEECNIVSKIMIQFIKAVFAGVIVGARVPVSLVSRTDTIKNKKTSLALAAVLADYYLQNSIFDNGGNND